MKQMIFITIWIHQSPLGLERRQLRFKVIKHSRRYTIIRTFLAGVLQGNVLSEWPMVVKRKSNKSKKEIWLSA